MILLSANVDMDVDVPHWRSKISCSLVMHDVQLLLLDLSYEIVRLILLWLSDLRLLWLSDLRLAHVSTSHGLDCWSHVPTAVCSVEIGDDNTLWRCWVSVDQTTRSPSLLNLYLIYSNSSRFVTDYCIGRQSISSSWNSRTIMLLICILTHR